jgi:hypothetical protein
MDDNEKQSIMKKLLPLVAIALILFTGACKKKDSEVTPGGGGSWTLAGVSYKIAITNRSPTSGSNPTILLNFWDAVPTADLKVNSVAFSFKETPTTSGTYQLVGGVGGTLTAKQFEIAAGTHTLYYAYLGTAVDVTVTVTNGKIKIVLPEITLKSTSSQPDAKLTGTFQEL